MSTNKDGLTRRSFLAAIPALAGVGLLGPRSLSAQEEEAFIGGILSHSHLLGRYRTIPPAAFTHPKLRLMWSLLKNLGAGWDDQFLWLQVVLASTPQLWQRLGGESFFERMSDHAAPAERIPDLARRLAAAAPPYQLSDYDFERAGLRAGDLRPVVMGQWGRGRTGFRSPTSWNFVRRGEV